MYAVTGATGHLGRLIVENLLQKGIDPGEIVAVVRNPQKAADLAERGMVVRVADYADREALEEALQGVDRLMLVSSNEVGQRTTHHRNVIDAAVKAGVRYVVYTSILKADTSPMKLAEEHKVSEEMIRASGIPFTILRNSWYFENYTENLSGALAHGALLGSAGEGRISAATRADYAAAAAAVLTGEGHEGTVYELGGDQAFTMAELAQAVTAQSGKKVVYRNLPEEEYVKALVGFGVPEPYARALADSDTAISKGALYTDRDDLRRLIGRPTTPLSEAVAAAFRS